MIFRPILFFRIIYYINIVHKLWGPRGTWILHQFQNFYISSTFHNQMQLRLALILNQTKFISKNVLYPKSCPTFCLMSYYNYYKGKKYAICILHTLCIPRYNFKKNNYFLCPQKYDYLVNDSLRNPNTEIPKKNWTRFLMSINN